MIRSTICIAAFLVARIGGCSGPQSEVAPETADLGPEVRIERPPEPSAATIPTPGEPTEPERTPPGDPAAAGDAGGDPSEDEPRLPPLPAPLGLLGGTEGLAPLDLPPGPGSGTDGVIVTPEPSTLLLAAAGILAGAAWRGFRRRRRS